MDLKSFITVFMMIFLAELGDKTQGALVTFVSGGHKPLPALLGAILGFAASSILAITLGIFLYKYIPPEIIKKIAAGVFVVIGIGMFFGKI
jgi:putative Ca2+/H+ antiporter (TMEM165/GDT1 family)